MTVQLNDPTYPESKTFYLKEKKEEEEEPSLFKELMDTLRKKKNQETSRTVMLTHNVPSACCEDLT